MKKIIPILFLLSINMLAMANKKAYVIYNKTGQKVSYDRMISSLMQKDIVLFGELHNNAIAHWLEYEVAMDLYAQRDLIMGAEMFEADNQLELNDFLTGKIDYKTLDSLARLWPNTKTDYRPLINFAKDSALAFIATNIPRRYARLVNKSGFESLDTLSAKEKEWIAPLPIKFDKDLPTYRKILEMMGAHGSPKLVMAQAIKDATMAYFIMKNFKRDYLFLHFNGAFHSDDYEGILWYLQQERNDLRYATISTVTQKDVNNLDEDNFGKADFVICVDEDMTTTY